MVAVSQHQFSQACGLLFGEQFTVTPETLEYLERAGIKQAFRIRAKSCHPDLNPGVAGVSPEGGFDFVRLKEACDLLLNLKTERLPRTFRPASPAPERNRTEKTGGEAAGSGRYRALPPAPLRLGEYLYYSGRITWDQLISGIVWQKRNRPRVGEMAVRRGLLNPEQVDSVMLRCRPGRGNLPEIKFGEAAVRMGLISPAQLESLLAGQRMLHPLGSFFAREGILTREELIRTLLDLRKHNLRWGR